MIAPGHTFHRDLLVTREDIAKFAGLCEDFNLCTTMRTMP